MPITYPYTQYTGIWNLSAAGKAKGAGTWPVPPVPYLYTWGSNNAGQLGLSNTTNYSSPKQVGSLTSWNKIYTGGDTNNESFSISIKTDGTLWGWGYNGNGQLGLGNTTNYSSPKQIGALTDWSSITAGIESVLGIKTNGTLWGWGRNQFGQLGLGNTTNTSSPVQVGALTNWSQVSNSSANTAAIKTDGTLWTWGFGGDGALGLGNTTNYSSPKQVGSLTNWSYVSVGPQYTMSIKTDGTLWGWGYNFRGNLGLGNTTDYSSPKQIGALNNWSKLTTGGLTFLGQYTNTLSIKTDGTLWAWGANTFGDLGLGNTTSYSSPKQVGSLTNWLKVNSAYQSTYAFKTDGTMWSWGRNNLGQLGLNTATTYYSSPKQVGSLTSWKEIATGNGYFGMAIAAI